MDEVAYEAFNKLKDQIYSSRMDLHNPIGTSEELHEQTFYNAEEITDKLWKAFNLLEEAEGLAEDIIYEMDEMREYDDDEEDY